MNGISSGPRRQSSSSNLSHNSNLQKTMSATAEETKMPLILKGEGYQLVIAPEFIKLRDDLIDELKKLGKITNPDDDAKVDALIKRAAQIRIITEKSRKEVIAPAVAFQKDTNSKAAEFMDALGPMEEAAKKLRGDYAQAVLAERQRVIAEQEAKRKEQERIAAEEKRKAEEAEAARIKAEQEAEASRRKAEKAAFAADSEEEEAAAAAAAEEAKRKAEEAAKIEAERAEAARIEAEKKASEVIAPAFVPEAPKGVKMVPDYEVENLDMLYRHNAGLVTLTERRKEILEAIARGTIGETLPEIPGLRVFMRPQVR